MRFLGVFEFSGEKGVDPLPRALAGWDPTGTGVGAKGTKGTSKQGVMRSGLAHARVGVGREPAGAGAGR